MKRYLVILSIGLAGCTSLPTFQPLCPGTRPYDPQICKGEKFQRLPNFENEAIIRRQRGEYW